jgi:hypothetical protein
MGSHRVLFPPLLAVGLLLGALAVMPAAAIAPEDATAPPSITEPLPEHRDWHTFIQTATTNAAMQAKARDAIAILDQRMAAIIADINTDLDPEAQALLATAQTTWRDYAWAQANFRSDVYRGGTHRGLAFGYAFIAAQVARIDELFTLERDRQQP